MVALQIVKHIATLHILLGVSCNDSREFIFSSHQTDLPLLLGRSDGRYYS